MGVSFNKKINIKAMMINGPPIKAGNTTSKLGNTKYHNTLYNAPILYAADTIILNVCLRCY